MTPAGRWGDAVGCLIAGMRGNEQAAEHTATRMEQIGTQRKRTSFRRSRCPNASWQPGSADRAQALPHLFPKREPLYILVNNCLTKKPDRLWLPLKCHSSGRRYSVPHSKDVHDLEPPYGIES
jgi:hypothetical protein